MVPRYFLQAGSSVAFPVERETAERPADTRERRADAELHVLTEPVRVCGLFYAACSCGQWISEGKVTRWQALTEVCAFARAEVEAADHQAQFARSLRIAG